VRCRSRSRCSLGRREFNRLGGDHLVVSQSRVMVETPYNLWMWSICKLEVK
jgi:hypothetical protein